jgi:hypothetical protein
MSANLPTAPESAALSIPAVARIRTLADELENMGTTVLKKAVEVGNLLSEAKEALPHGQWIPWLEKNVNFNARTAQRWMKVAEEHAAGRLKYDSVSYLSEAYQLSVAPRPSTAEERTTKPKPEVPAPAPAPAPARRSPAPVIDAEIVDPSTVPHDEVEPDAVVVDGIKEAHQPEVVDTAKPAALTHNEAKRLEVLEAQVEMGSLMRSTSAGCSIATRRRFHRFESGRLCHAGNVAQLPLFVHKIAKTCKNSKRKCLKSRLLKFACPTTHWLTMGFGGAETAAPWRSRRRHHSILAPLLTARSSGGSPTRYPHPTDAARIPRADRRRRCPGRP